MDAEMLLKLMTVMKSGQNAGGGQGGAGVGSGQGGAASAATNGGNPLGGFPLSALFAGMGAGGAQGGGGNALSALLPLLLAGMNTGAANGGKQGSGAQNNVAGNMLPLLLSMMSGGNTFGGTAAGGNPFANASRNNDEARDDGRAYGRGDDGDGCSYEARGYDGAYAKRRSYDDGGANTYARNAYAARAPHGAPFDDIGFAGAEVRGFMEKLWRLRRRV